MQGIVVKCTAAIFFPTVDSTRLFANLLTASPLAFMHGFPVKIHHSHAKFRQLTKPKGLDGNKMGMRAGNNKHKKSFCIVFAKRYKNYSYPELELLSARRS